MKPEVAAMLPAQPHWLESSTVYLTRHGSHAYGTNIATSDLDVKGVAVPPRVYFTGFSQVFEQAISAAPVDLTVFDIRKFCKLAADCNPSIIEVLWTDESDVLYLSEAGRTLREQRHMFLSQKAKYTFTGYAVSQLKRIKTHRRWLLTPPSEKPTRQTFGLPETRLIGKDHLGAALARIKRQLDSWELDLSDIDDARRLYIEERVARVIQERSPEPDRDRADFMAAGKLLGFESNMLEYLDAEKRYEGAVREWDQYNLWKSERNEARAALEAKYGYDTKHAMHLVRLMRMCREILTDHVVHVKRPDAQELLSIRSGWWSYDQLIEYTDSCEQEMNALVRTTTLRKNPDRAFLDGVCMAVVQDRLGIV